LAYRNSTAVRQAVAQLGAKHKFIKPHCPWQNGKVERFNRTLQIEWAYRRVFLSNPTVPPHLPPGWSSTTLDADTPHLAASHQPADCHQPCDRVHLGGAMFS
jgi:transposase InsO family protein